MFSEPIHGMGFIIHKTTKSGIKWEEKRDDVEKVNHGVALKVSRFL